MYKLLVILMVFLMSAQSSYQGLIYTYYVANKDYIKKQLCENRAEPELKCDGKCHLKKILAISKKGTIEEPQPFLPSLEEIKTPVLFCQEISTILYQCVVTSTTEFLTQRLFEYTFVYQYLPIFSAFQPPEQ